MSKCLESVLLLKYADVQGWSFPVGDCRESVSPLEDVVALVKDQLGITISSICSHEAVEVSSPTFLI